MDNRDWIERAQQGLKELDVAEVRQTGILPQGGNAFFPVVGYPPHTMLPSMAQEDVFETYQQRRPNPITAYAHIPFCPSRCTYCHWITKTKSRQDEVEDYLDHIEQEMALYAEGLGYDAIPADSALIGGGTPTYLSAKQLERFLTAFTRYFDLSNSTQFSVEAEPTTLLGEEGLAKLRVLKDFGVQRISLGVQSFDDPILASMGRTHNHAESLQSIEQIRKAGIDNVFIDLIYAYPNQTVEQWLDNLRQVVSLGIEGYQLFRLRIKQHGDRQGNIMNTFVKAPERFPDAEPIWLMKYLGKMMSEEHGYIEQQTRIFARKADDVSHYNRDWCCNLHDIAGVGVSTFSNLRGVFAMSMGDHNLENYYAPVRAGKTAIDRGRVRTADEEARRSFILPLKNAKVSKADFRDRTGKEANDYFADEIQWFTSLGMVEQDDKYISLTRRGRFFADEVAAQFFDPEYLTYKDVANAWQRASAFV
jgi:oxygen-independent coproporphyrinogen-3 oxidase